MGKTALLVSMGDEENFLGTIPQRIHYKEISNDQATLGILNTLAEPIN